MKAWVQTSSVFIDLCRFDGGPSLKDASEEIGKARKQQMEVCDAHGGSRLEQDNVDTCSPTRISEPLLLCRKSALQLRKLPRSGKRRRQQRKLHDCSAGRPSTNHQQVHSSCLTRMLLCCLRSGSLITHA